MRITLTGSGLSPSPQVYIEQICVAPSDCQVTASGDGTSATVTFPTNGSGAFPGYHDVYVIVNNQQSNTEELTVTPVVSAVSPALGPVGDSVSVTITGAGFGSAPSVSASGITVTNVSVNSPGTQITATFQVSVNATGNPAVVVTAGGQNNSSQTFHVQIPAELMRQDVPGAPGGVGPLQVVTNGNVVDLAGDVVLSGQCGVYRNYAFSLVEADGTFIEGSGTTSFTFTEFFGNYSSNPPGHAPPPTKTSAQILGSYQSDIQYIGHPYPTCLGSNDHESFDITFSATISGKAFPLSTVDHIDRGYFNGTATVNSTITTP